jgi:hypothetical protein
MQRVQRHRQQAQRVGQRDQQGTRMQAGTSGRTKGWGVGQGHGGYRLGSIAQSIRVDGCFVNVLPSIGLPLRRLYPGTDRSSENGS